MPDLTRRSVLGAGALGIGVVAVAACGASSSKSSSGGGAEKSADAGGPTGLIKLSDVPVGGCASAKLNGKPVMVSQKTAGVVTAFTAVCTHMGCTVNPAGAEFHCPCHGSKYNAFTGEVIQGPAPRALASIAVDVVAGEVTTTSAT